MACCQERELHVGARRFDHPRRMFKHDVLHMSWGSKIYLMIDNPKGRIRNTDRLL